LRRYPALAAVLVLALSLAAQTLACGSGGDGQPTDDAARVRGAAQTIRTAIQSDDWKTVYRSFADAFRDQCTEADFVAGATERAESFKTVNFDVGEVVVEGDSATAAIIYSNGAQTTDQWPFVREHGEWHLLSATGIEGCGFTTPTPTPASAP